MKYLAILLALAGGYWLYNKQTSQDQYGEDLISQLNAGKPVSIEQAKTKSNEIVNILCNDAGFQSSIGSTVSECLSRYADFREICESRIFSDNTVLIKTEEELKGYTTEFRKCVVKNT